MDRRNSLKLMGLGAAALAAPEMGLGVSAVKRPVRNWIWIRPDDKQTDAQRREMFRLYKRYGIYGVFIEWYHEATFKAAANAGLSTHLWMWTTNRRDQWIRDNHPEWYAVSRSGKSCYDQPPYVEYYRWVCPSRKEVGDYLVQFVRDHLKKPYVQGIHLDYVRFCDVILPVELWPTYNLVQTQELPDYDFCYCDVCRSQYKALYGKDPKDITYPSDQYSWRKFRYDAVTRLVNRLADVVHAHKKPITAAVFPTPEIAQRIVRQDWTRWKLDAVCPMVYHSFYLEPERWIGEAVEQGVFGLRDTKPLYAGLYLPGFADEEAFRSGVHYARNNGASGISLFGDVTEGQLKILAALK